MAGVAESPHHRHHQRYQTTIYQRFLDGDAVVKEVEHESDGNDDAPIGTSSFVCLRLAQYSRERMLVAGTVAYAAADTRSDTRRGHANNSSLPCGPQRRTQAACMQLRTAKGRGAGAVTMTRSDATPKSKACVARATLGHLSSGRSFWAVSTRPRRRRELGA